jgi:hypothetical protein
MAIFFIKKIWQNETDESVHSQFIRFSRGKFENKFVTTLSRNGKCKLNSTFELANNLVVFASGIAQKMRVNGILLTRENPDSLIKQIDIKAASKKKAAIFASEIDAELTAEQIKKISDVAYFMLFDCIGDGIELKIKKKLPKPSKSGSEKVNDKFCVLEADIKHWQKIKEEFAFDIDDFKKAQVRHTVEINDVILPQGEKDFEKLRLNAKKKGIITRNIVADGRENSDRKEFVA